MGELEQYIETRRLTTRLVLQAQMIYFDYEQIDGLIKKFQEKVWNPWLCDFISQSRERSHKWDDDLVEVLEYTLAGRTLITIKNKASEATVALIFAEGYKEEMGGGLQGIDATCNEATSLINHAMNNMTWMNKCDDVAIA